MKKENPHITGRYTIIAALIAAIAGLGGIVLKDYLDNNKNQKPIISEKIEKPKKEKQIKPELEKRKQEEPVLTFLREGTINEVEYNKFSELNNFYYKEEKFTAIFNNITKGFNAQLIKPQNIETIISLNNLTSGEKSTIIRTKEKKWFKNKGLTEFNDNSFSTVTYKDIIFGDEAPGLEGKKSGKTGW